MPGRWTPGRTPSGAAPPRTAVMFGPAGHLYVYFTYGMHFCANVVTGPDGEASAVLLRAGEVVDGHEVAAARRPGVRERDRARGPARLATTLGLGRAQNGLSLVDPDGAGPHRASGDAGRPRTSVRTGPRVGRQRRRWRRSGLPVAALARRRADRQPLPSGQAAERAGGARRLSGMRLVPVTALAATLLLTACGSTAGPGAATSRHPPPPPRARSSRCRLRTARSPASGTVLQPPDGPAGLCLGPVAESFPPQCDGFPLVGWDWETQPGRTRRPTLDAPVTRWGTYAVTGELRRPAPSR